VKDAFPRHVIERVRYALETIECTCGEVVTADPDPVIPDRHEPLAIVWGEHRAQAGARPRHLPRSIFGKAGAQA
jgi:hypothetical protein